MEIPYIAVQTLIFGLINYFMVNYERNISKFFVTRNVSNPYGLAEILMRFQSSTHNAIGISLWYFSLFPIL